MKEFIRKNLNVPNVLSTIRLLLVPVYILLFVKGQKYSALLVFCIASLTDLLDGFIARKYKLITDLGKLLDPLADKLMVLSAMFSMTIGNRMIPPVLPLPAVLIVLAKEIYMVIGGILVLKRGFVVYSKLIGKAAHCVFIGGLIASYFHDFFTEHCAAWFLTPDLILVWTAVVLTLIAAVNYTCLALQAVRNGAENQNGAY